MLRGDGYFTIDISFAKAWSMPWSKNQKLRFRWDIFNLTNTPRMDVGNVTMFPDRATRSGPTTDRLRPATAAPAAACSMQFVTSSRRVR